MNNRERQLWRANFLILRSQRHTAHIPKGYFEVFADAFIQLGWIARSCAITLAEFTEKHKDLIAAINNYLGKGVK